MISKGQWVVLFIKEMKTQDYGLFFLMLTSAFIHWENSYTRLAFGGKLF